MVVFEFPLMSCVLTLLFLSFFAVYLNMFVKVLDIENYQASDGCLRRRKDKNSTKFKTVLVETDSVTPDMANAQCKTSLGTLLLYFDLKEIYNSSGFGLFYQCFPNKAYQIKSEKCSRGKLSKFGIKDMAVANVIREI